MMMPSIFGNNFVDDVFDDMFPFAGNYTTANYDQMEMSGVEKENIKAELKDGYLTVTAQQNTNKDEKDKQGNYIRRERYSGSCQRSFYVGEGVKQEDLKAAFNNGILTVAVPKEVQKPVEEKQYITIE